MRGCERFFMIMCLSKGNEFWQCTHCGHKNIQNPFHCFVCGKIGEHIHTCGCKRWLLPTHVKCYCGEYNPKAFWWLLWGSLIGHAAKEAERLKYKLEDMCKAAQENMEARQTAINKRMAGSTRKFLSTKTSPCVGRIGCNKSRS